MGKSGICKLSTLAILSGDMSNTSLSNCGNMRPHVTANPSSNSSIVAVSVPKARFCKVLWDFTYEVVKSLIVHTWNANYFREFTFSKGRVKCRKMSPGSTDTAK